MNNNIQVKKNDIFDLLNFESSISWIKQQQNSEGAYTAENDLVLPECSTNGVLNTFHDLGLTIDAAQVRALGFLNVSSDDNTEWLARRIIANTYHRVNNDVLINQLKSYQNLNGEFGFTQGFDSFIRDTALVIDALWQYRAVYALNNQLQNGQAWLLNSRNSNGDWNYTDYTALALLAVIPSLKDVVEVKSAIEYLINEQIDNGSWENDVYVTSLVLRALNSINNSDIGTPLLQGKIVDESGKNPIAHSGYAERQINITISTLQTTQIGDVYLKQLDNLAILTGFITDQSTGKSINNAIITLSTGSVTHTSSKGHYELALLEGDVTVTVSAYGYYDVSAKLTAVAGATIIFSPALSSTEIFPMTSSLSGRILDRNTGLPIQGATIQQKDGAQKISDYAGAFKFTELQAGRYTYIVSVDEYLSQTIQVTITSHGNIILDDILLQLYTEDTTSILQGIITDEVGKPLNNAKVELTGSTNTGILTGTDGAYKISGLKAGDIVVAVSLDGHQSITSSLTINSSENIHSSAHFEVEY